ncbi:MAG: LacI family DNA-binding transcriptional regulator [Clostridiales bacterium]|jgi:LacI family kdg operon repressor|nr:LacI family DNA-binding transcriptional regulator [Clostridiales bacterium]
MNNNIKRAKTTIDQVASDAGVSTTTISRYLNGKFEYMSVKTREKIQKVIEELDYRPSNIARSLKSHKSGAVGCIIADITNPFSSYIVKGVNDVCRKNGYQVLFSNTDNRPESEIESIKSLLDNQLEGLIVNTTGYIDDYLIDLNNQGLPIVMADRCLKNRFLLDTITTENYDSTFDCFKFLKNQGYDKVVFFTLEIGNNSSRYIRHSAYIDAMAKLYGIDGNHFTYILDKNNTQVCRNYLKDLKNSYPNDEIAIFAVNGVALLNILHSMKQEKMEIAKDFGVCSFDDWEWTSLIEPGITTIAQDSYKTGVKAAQLLLKRIEAGNDGKKKYSEIPPKLVVRGSTTPYRLRNSNG